uniref:zinc finger and BTB domain-containing protein 40 n=1 Tax=Doryrhamphus excisus TaxID=161450 RepID=UPI0025AEBE7A|nr:zinc finger and BTB domain-containing protein 40 [Doryrhamphus excisus]XP_057934903.1 zinc finger and BTB domain-containing protein 40 [Doryrhamphus excisus]
MIELPNYSSQLMQQLCALRKEGHFCDCTILVGDNPHRAHKLVLAASSMLFRSLLDSSDTVSIDTTVVSSQEFVCLLDMVYTGKLPFGKHNVSRIIAAADSLQMFDVAVSFKNVLTNIINQQQPASSNSTQITAHPKHPHASPAPAADETPEGGMEVKHQSAEEEENEKAEEPECKRVRQDLSETSGPEDSKATESVEPEENITATEDTTEAAPARLERSSQLMELLANVPDVLQLLSQAAQGGLDQEERQVVTTCCEDSDPNSAVKKLKSQVEKGLVGEEALLKLLRCVRQNAPSSFPAPLLSRLEDLDKVTEEEPGGGQNGVNPEQDTRSEVKMEESSKQNPDEEEEEEEVEETDADSPCPSKAYCCHWCKKIFAYKCRLAAHKRRCPMSDECQLPCPHCSEKLANQRALQRHLTEAHPGSAGAKKKKKISCDLCGRTFAHPSGMIYHKRTEHFDEKPFACETCGAKFSATSSLKNHMRLHTGEKPFRCKHCDMSFSVSAALAYHTKKKHSEGKMYVCQYCKAVFAQSIELSRHVRTHTGDRPYVCRECGKGHSQASGLTVHLQTFHNLPQPLDCPKCCLSFQTLEEHQKHNEEFHLKEFHKCPTCDKVFTSAALLDKHKTMHTGLKPFICNLCNKSYQQLSGLWYHNRTNHPDVFTSQTRQLKTLVQCDVCFRFFPSSSSLAKHRKAEHEGSAASTLHCPHCQDVFGGHDELQTHINSQHEKSIKHWICPLCSQVSTSQPELQEHLLSCHMEAQQTQEEASQEQAPNTHTTVSVQEAEDVACADGSQVAVAQQVFVALDPPSEVVEVNMFDLLNNSVTFICEDKAADV